MEAIPSIRAFCLTLVKIERSRANLEKGRERDMKRLLKLAIFLSCVASGGAVWGGNEDNRPIGADAVRAIGKQVDSLYLIRFSTTIPANTNVVILPEHWIQFTSPTAAMAWTSGVTYSTTPRSQNGGRLYAYFQAIEAAAQGDTGQKLHWSFNTTVSTNTDPYITQGQDWPPQEWPFVYQSTVTVFSTNTFKIGGFIITEKSRR